MVSERGIQKYFNLRNVSAWNVSQIYTIRETKVILACVSIYATLLKTLLCDFLLINLTTNEAETSTGKLYTSLLTENSDSGHGKKTWPTKGINKNPLKNLKSISRNLIIILPMTVFLPRYNTQPICKWAIHFPVFHQHCKDFLSPRGYWPSSKYLWQAMTCGDHRVRL